MESGSVYVLSQFISFHEYCTVSVSLPKRLTTLWTWTIVAREEYAIRTTAVDHISSDILRNLDSGGHHQEAALTQPKHVGVVEVQLGHGVGVDEAQDWEQENRQHPCDDERHRLGHPVYAHYDHAPRTSCRLLSVIHKISRPYTTKNRDLLSYFKTKMQECQRWSRTTNEQTIICDQLSFSRSFHIYSWILITFVPPSTPRMLDNWVRCLKTVTIKII